MQTKTIADEIDSFVNSFNKRDFNRLIICSEKLNTLIINETFKLRTAKDFYPLFFSLDLPGFFSRLEAFLHRLLFLSTSRPAPLLEKEIEELRVSLHLTCEILRPAFIDSSATESLRKGETNMSDVDPSLLDNLRDTINNSDALAVLQKILEFMNKLRRIF